MPPLTDDDPHRIGRYRTLAVLGAGGMGRAAVVFPDVPG